MPELPPSPAVPGPLVLVVDDDEDTRLNLTDILELDGYRVEGAGSARELLSRSHWDDVALVLLDRKLPDGSPQELIPQIQQSAPQAAIIVVTGYADIEGAIAALRSGAADYILKPVHPDALRASIEDVLDRRRAEKRYRWLFENTLDGLLMLDDDGGIVAANPAACALLDRQESALLAGRLESMQIRTGESSRPAAWSDFLRERTNIGECSILRRDGACVDVEYRAVTGFAPGLNLISLHDVTARKQAEERARQAERLAAIGETMAALVHESRNALQRSKASLEMLLLEIEDRPEAVKLVVRAQRAQEDLHRLYEEVRQWAAPLNLRRESCNLRDLWKEVWCLVKQAHPARDARLVEEVTCKNLVGEVDQFLISQVFRNVFENALEVSPAGSEVTIQCSDAAGSDEILIAIRDQGPGLTLEQQRRIFEPFFTTKAKGTGLGMAIAYRIIQSHRGAIAASSPQGAQIEIKLPR
jgi:two-component system, LuxR family, sensor kinase FixL